jgi:type III restriction enzyme
MQLRFDSDQAHQLEAIESVVSLFDHARPGSEALSAPRLTIPVVSNDITIDGPTLLRNIQDVQRRNHLPIDSELEFLVVEGRPRSANATIEMETGTGKTYCYLRTALELARQYLLRKFLVVVPSVAVREGVLKTLKTTETHFRDLYPDVPYRYDVFDSSRPQQTRDFAISSGVEFLILTIDAFTREENLIRQPTDALQGERPIEFLVAARSIIILDEPQNMETEIRRRAISELSPLILLRYSATHRRNYNLVYRLSAADAYRRGLVKRIEVAGVDEDSASDAFVRLISIGATRKSVMARIQVRSGPDAAISTVTVRSNDDLRLITGRHEYAGYRVTHISSHEQCLSFSNDTTLSIGDSTGEQANLFEAQIRYAVEEHFRKDARLVPLNVKVLTLFFVPSVRDYTDPNGAVRKAFTNAFESLKINYSRWATQSVERIQTAYFAQRRRRDGSVELLESTSGQAEADRDAYDLILRNKERLLSFDEPASFIFSHSALREGWDNPNVFQICTLGRRASELRKRQEIGRGVRLAVTQDGERILRPDVNVLTVISAESYEQYARGLQAEFAEDGSPDGAPPIANARAKRTLIRAESVLASSDFRDGWAAVAKRSKYTSEISSSELIRSVAAELADDDSYGRRYVTLSRGELHFRNDGDAVILQTASHAPIASRTRSRFDVDMLSLIAEGLLNSVPSVGITRRTIARIIRTINRDDDIISDPDGFAAAAVRAIRQNVADQRVETIAYYESGSPWPISLFPGELVRYEDKLENCSRSIYNAVPVDSTTERRFVRRLDERDDVHVFWKFPDGYSVPTPVGSYTPDWGIVADQRDAHGRKTGTLRHLVRETKGSLDREQLRISEERKIACARAHYAAINVDYDVADDADQAIMSTKGRHSVR